MPTGATVSCAYPVGGVAARPVEPPSGTEVAATGTVAVVLDTNFGPIDLTLDRDLAPCAVHSFLSLARQGFFTATPCHRLTTDLGLQVLQCGDPDGTGRGGPGYTLPDELDPPPTYARGVLAMAATPEPDSSGSQFFMVYGDAQIPPDYTAFGTVGDAGLAVIDTIAALGQDGSPGTAGGGSPNQPVTITAVTGA